ncbi:MAG: glycerol-3-phosphate 1-O-acyltransferase PlsY [Oscillibacter sp.]|nr:glycerol-3-phosphate 1-O-acyltransferase PlsY [Oscillibacter sp.]
MPEVSNTAIALTFAISAVAAYFCGCFNGAVIVSKYILRDDVRNHGSGNAGLTNFHRVFGGPLTFVVILCDVLKAVVALTVGMWLFSRVTVYDAWAGMWPVLVKYWAGLFCLLGHMFPCMFHFKGGKGILSGGTIAIMIDWRVALVVWGGFLILTALTRYVSLGSVWAGGSFPFISWICYPNPVIVALAFACGGLVVWKHRGNIKRLLSGTESKLTFRKKGDKR